MKKQLLAASAATVLSTSAAALTIEFDYTYAGTFFTTGHRAILESIADDFGARITDSLAAINSSGINDFRPSVSLASNGTVDYGVTQSLAADTLRVFVGAAVQSGTTLAVGGAGGYDSVPVQFSNLIATRGQPEPQSQNFSTWGGNILFDSDTNWYIDDDVSTVESFAGQFDFYSVAVHELGHVLGIGTSAAWVFDRNNSNTAFTGTAAVAVYGADVPLADPAHLAQSVSSTFMGQVQQSAMTPSISAGTRKYFTDLDWALLQDVGWQVTAVPEAHTWAMMLAGLGLLGWRSRRRIG
ncbi:MAG: matrixin family metalloprotease [Rhodocyclaceae bacterium]|nr:matrixin family metalloprotease [Rhodocyclaceae bacterium]